MRSRTRTCVMVLNEMLDHDRSCVGLRRELQHLREEGADKEQLDEKVRAQTAAVALAAATGVLQ